jgi:glycosyltransferase involved in cell wall biosynthesis
MSETAFHINKLRVLHSTSMIADMNSIKSQMEWEQQAANKLGIPWCVIIYCSKNVSSESTIFLKNHFINYNKKFNILKRKFIETKLSFYYYKWLIKQEKNFDYFIIRYQPYDLFQLIFILMFKSKILTIHHSLEVYELKSHKNILGFIKSFFEILIGKIALSNVDGIIGVTQEILEYENNRSLRKIKNKFIYPNGIYLNYIDEFNVIDKRRGNVPVLLFVASRFAPWHGLDLIINSILSNEENFILHLVGDIPVEYKFFLKDKRIITHGILSQKKLNYLYEESWVGLGSFGLYRNQMKQACILKVREYLLMGLPVYANYDDIFSKEEIFFMKGNPNIKEIINFAFEIRNISKKKVFLLSKNYIDKIILLDDLYSKIKCIK